MMPINLDMPHVSKTDVIDFSDNAFLLFATRTYLKQHLIRIKETFEKAMFCGSEEHIANPLTQVK